MNKDTLLLCFTGVLVVCALIITGLLVRREFFPPSPSLSISVYADWQAVAAEGNIQGSPDAPVKIVEFYDYECPFCRQLQPAIKEVVARYGDQVALVRRHFPLEAIHPNAVPAAIAVECAARQDAFEPYHTLLFANQARLGRIPWDTLAVEAGVEDVEQFHHCVALKQPLERIHSDVQVAHDIGINATPTLMVNGMVV